jgi:hypothetical protein
VQKTLVFLAFAIILVSGFFWDKHLTEELCKNRPPNFDAICLARFIEGDTGWGEYKQWCEVKLHGKAEEFEELWYGKFLVKTYACHELGKQ